VHSVRQALGCVCPKTSFLVPFAPAGRPRAAPRPARSAAYADGSVRPEQPKYCNFACMHRPQDRTRSDQRRLSRSSGGAQDPPKFSSKVKLREKATLEFEACETPLLSLDGAGKSEGAAMSCPFVCDIQRHRCTARGSPTRRGRPRAACAPSAVSLCRNLTSVTFSHTE
jgi:hypothetical protein